MVASLVVLIAGCGGGGGTGSSPEAAVEGLAQAIEEKDVAGALAHIDPDEVPGILSLWERVYERGQKIGLLSGGSGLDGFTITVSDLDLAVKEETAAAARVAVNRGSVTAAIDPASLPGAMARALDADAPSSGTLDSFNDFRATPTVVTVKRGGDWYVSLGLTIADAVAAAQGAGTAPLEALEAASAPQAPPEPTPERAARRFIEAQASGSSLRVLADAMTPAARRALLFYDGFGTYLDDTLSSADFSSGFTVEDLDVEVREASGGRQTVVVTSLTGSSFGSDGTSSGRFRLVGPCAESSDGSGTSLRSCLDGTGFDDPQYVPGLLSGFDQFWSGILADEFGFDGYPAMAKVKTPLIYVVAPEGEGWAVDPVATVAAQIEQILDTADDATLLEVLGATN